LADVIRTVFAAPDGGFYSTAADHEPLVVRYREGADGATPSANAEAARLLARLGSHRGDAGLRDAATAAINAWAGALRQGPRAFATTLAVADFLLDGPVEIGIVGAADDGRTEALWAALGTRFIPHRIIAHGLPGELKPSLLAGKGLVGGAPAVYLCRDFVCHAPVTHPDGIAL
jgi:hypothetical protein